MSIRRLRNSFGDVFKRNGSTDSTQTSVHHFQWIYRQGEWRLAYEDGDEAILMYTKHERLPLKDFAAEVRASVDVEQFLDQAILLLDIHETTNEGIVEAILHKVLDEREFRVTMAEAKNAIFTEGSVQLFSRTVQGTYIKEDGGMNYDQSWICAMSNLSSLQKRHVAIARLKHLANMGSTRHEVRFFILVLTPTKEKGTKNDLETGRTFATIFADINLRQRLLEAHSEADFKQVLLKHTRDLVVEQNKPENQQDMFHNESDFKETRWKIGQGLRNDVKRRKRHYFSDFIDGFVGHKTIHKTSSTIFFLYFACILPTIAFGALYDNITHGAMDVKKGIIAQTIGGLVFALIGGQPLVIIMTTVPLSLYIKVIYSICEDFDLNFHAMYACVGLWNTFFLILYSIFDASRIMKWSTRSAEEIFSLFICLAFIVAAGKDVYKTCSFGSFSKGSEISQVLELPLQVMNNISMNESQVHEILIQPCKRANSLLFLILMLGTVWLAVSLYNFNKTPYLQANKREILADYALPVAVITLSLFGSYLFRAVPTDHFRYNANFSLNVAPLNTLPGITVLAAFGLGFALSLLFFIDQNISAAMVNNPSNKLKKGPAYHLDLLVVGIINGFLSLYGLPWMHGVLPHSPLHVRSLADVEERVERGHIHEISRIVKVRETRVTGITCHILIGLSVLLLPYPMAYIPTAVLDGLFLYMAITSLNGNQMFERITLLFMEQAAYPPNHYIRRCPQRKIHTFTMCQMFQLAVMCFFGFCPWPYIKMVFPVIIFLLIPIRQKIVPYIVDKKYLEALDGTHH